MRRAVASSAEAQLDELFASARQSPNPVLSSLEPTIRESKHISMDMEKLREAAATIPAEKVTFL